MKNLELEAWVLQVVETVKAKHSVEDSRVELKAEWTSPGRASRRLAALCNAARGEPVLWLVGLDEERGPVGARMEDVADWGAQLDKWFDRLSPELMKQLAVPVDGVTLQAFLFGTERAPYVVHVERDGAKTERLEVPYRVATGTRSARREDLIRLVSSAAAVPQGKFLDVHIDTNFEHDAMLWGRVQVYVDTGGSTRAVFPFHLAHAGLSVEGGVSTTLKIRDSGTEQTPHILVSRSEAILSGPGMLHLELSGGTTLPDLRGYPGARLELELPQLGEAKSLRVVENLVYVTQSHMDAGWYSKYSLEHWEP